MITTDDDTLNRDTICILYATVLNSTLCVYKLSKEALGRMTVSCLLLAPAALPMSYLFASEPSVENLCLYGPVVLSFILLLSCCAVFTKRTKGASILFVNTFETSRLFIEGYTISNRERDESVKKVFERASIQYYEVKGKQ